jgi:flagellar basal body-associated protein FliL
MNKEDKKFNLKGLLAVIIVVNVFLAIAAYFIDFFY